LETATEDVNWQVRNHHNGFVFTRSGFDTPEAVSKAAMDAMRILGLDFGAVDVVYNSRENRAYVLEVNTAPGLEGSTVDDYANYFVGRTTNG
jgi:glutathione synthase/RimK-type ligase-like ATP-grasp enzyme